MGVTFDVTLTDT